MPKTNLAQSITKRRMDFVRGMLAGGKAQSGKTTVDIATKFGVTDRTICRWFDKPESMNLLDFYQFCDELGLKISIAFKDVPE